DGPMSSFANGSSAAPAAAPAPGAGLGRGAGRANGSLDAAAAPPPNAANGSAPPPGASGARALTLAVVCVVALRGIAERTGAWPSFTNGSTGAASAGAIEAGTEEGIDDGGP